MHSDYSQYVKSNASQEDTKSIRMGAESNHTNKLTDSKGGGKCVGGDSETVDV